MMRKWANYFFYSYSYKNSKMEKLNADDIWIAIRYRTRPENEKTLMWSVNQIWQNTFLYFSESVQVSDEKAQHFL